MNRKELKALIKECLESIDISEAPQKPDYRDAIYTKMRLAKKAKNAEEVVYYGQALQKNDSAVADFKVFKGSWAYTEWKKKADIIKAIAAVEADFKRFSYLNESADGQVLIKRTDLKTKRPYLFSFDRYHSAYDSAVKKHNTEDIVKLASKLIDDWNKLQPQNWKYEVHDGKGGLHTNEVKANPDMEYAITPKEKKVISANLMKYPELNGLKKYDREGGKSAAITLISNALSDAGFVLDMVSGDMLIGQKGSRRLTFTKKSTNPDPHIEGPQVINSMISMSWENLSQDHYNPNYEITVYLT